LLPHQTSEPVNGFAHPLLRTSMNMNVFLGSTGQVQSFPKIPNREAIPEELPCKTDMHDQYPLFL